MRLETAPYLRIVPSYAAGDVRWGLASLVEAIDRAARAVRRQFPDSVTSVGHLSRSGGGDLDRHHSHESGRDADVGFFVRDHQGRELLADHFVSFRADGTAASWPGAYFDDAKNWSLVQALVTDPQAHVTHLFVWAPLRARLLAFAERIGAPMPVRVRAAEVMTQPRGALPHDDHFHVRIACPAHMQGCIEQPTSMHARRPPHGPPRARDRGYDQAERHPSLPVGAVRKRPAEAQPAGRDKDAVASGSAAAATNGRPATADPGATRRIVEVPAAAATVPLDLPIDDVDGEL
jgi:penicillin-insensitive murein DD-endopeptidase